MKGHDLQHWQPLRFVNGVPQRLARLDEWVVELT